MAKPCRIGMLAHCQAHLFRRTRHAMVNVTCSLLQSPSLLLIRGPIANVEEFFAECNRATVPLKVTGRSVIHQLAMTSCGDERGSTTFGAPAYHQRSLYI